MKFLKFAAVTIAFAGFSAPVLAQASATQTVNVGIALTSKCQFTTSTAIAFSKNYTAFQAGDVNDSASATLHCTRGGGLPTVTWDGPAGPAVGVVSGLAYQLTATVTAGVAGTAPAGTAISDVGTARTASVGIDLLIPKEQAGGPSTAAAARTLTVTF